MIDRTMKVFSLAESARLLYWHLNGVSPGKAASLVGTSTKLVWQAMAAHVLLFLDAKEDDWNDEKWQRRRERDAKLWVEGQLRQQGGSAAGDVERKDKRMAELMVAVDEAEKNAANQSVAASQNLRHQLELAEKEFARKTAKLTADVSTYLNDCRAAEKRSDELSAQVRRLQRHNAELEADLAKLRAHQGTGPAPTDAALLELDRQREALVKERDALRQELDQCRDMLAAVGLSKDKLMADAVSARLRLPEPAGSDEPPEGKKYRAIVGQVNQAEGWAFCQTSKVMRREDGGAPMLGSHCAKRFDFVDVCQAAGASSVAEGQTLWLEWLPDVACSDDLVTMEHRTVFKENLMQAGVGEPQASDVAGIVAETASVERMRLALAWIARMPAHRAEDAVAIARAVLLNERLEVLCESRRWRHNCGGEAKYVVDGPATTRHACCDRCREAWLSLEGYVVGPVEALFPGLDKLLSPV